MPYAHGATIKHEFDVDHLNVWLTFRHPMDQDVKPAHNLWTLTVDDVDKAISASTWQDEYTLLLESDAVVVYPDRVLLAYDGPSGNLQTTWGKNWEPWGDALSSNIGEAITFVDRGDPGAADWTQATLTVDNAWHALDVSAIVPASASAICFGVFLRDNLVGRVFALRKSGHVNVYNVSGLYTQIANVIIQQDFTVAASPNQEIQYKISVGMDLLALTVRGWWV